MKLIVVITIMLLLCVSGFMAATETAITASSPGKIHKMKSKGNKRAKLLLNIIKVKNKVISSLLIGNSLFNTICTTIATGLFIEIFGDDFGTIISSIVMSFLIIVFAEVVPKAIAVAKPESIAIFTAPIVNIMLMILYPINAFLEWITKVFCFVLRIDLNTNISGTDEVRGVIEHQVQEGNVYKRDSDMLMAILDLRSIEVSEIMIHRSEVSSINIDLPIDEIIKTAVAMPHTRIPMWRDSPDNVIGILHLRNLLNKLQQEEKSKINIEAMLIPPRFIPEHALAMDQLNNFRHAHSHLACVVDEYGVLLGIVTLEDVLESIVGSINDEHDLLEDKVIKKSPTQYILDGSVSVRDLNRELGWDLPEDDAATIAGLIIHKMARIPNQGEKFLVKNIQFVITNKQDNRIKTVMATIMDNDTET